MPGKHFLQYITYCMSKGRLELQFFQFDLFNIHFPGKQGKRTYYLWTFSL